MKTIIDKNASTIGPDGKTLPEDVRTTFVTYKALDRLRLLAESAAKPTTGSAERANLQKSFAKGLADLKTYLGSAPSDDVDLAFGKLARQALSVGVASPSSLSAASIPGKGVRDTRDGALAGFKGDEVLKIDLAQLGAKDSLTIDLAKTPQPPTLDTVADAMNAAIKAIPRLDAKGAVVMENGKPVPRWQVSFEPAKNGDKWGMAVKRGGFETISIDQVGGGDAVMVASGLTERVPLAAGVPSGTTPPLNTPADTRILRLDDPAGTMERRTLSTIAAVDRIGTERSAVAAEADLTRKTKEQTVIAATPARGIATDAQGFSYVVGTTAGDLRGNVSDGGDDMILTKVDSEGTVVWQRGLGAAGAAQGAAVTIAPDGGIVVAGTVTGNFDGASADGDLVVTRFDAQGNEAFSSLVRSVGKQTATAVAVGADGMIYVGGKNDSGDAVLARIDAAGKPVQQFRIKTAGTDEVKALAIGADGQLLALTGESGRAMLRRIDKADLTKELASIDLGKADARAIAIDADGAIAVVGAADDNMPGTQVNSRAGGRDGFVARIDAALSSSKVTYLGSTGEDQADSVSFLGDTLYIGGRTTGKLGLERTGDVDGFVARVDAATGAIGKTQQFGTIAAKTQPVHVSAVAGGNSVLGKLGLHRGTLTPTDAVTLEAQTALRAGDEFSIRINGGAIRKVTIGEKDTLTTLANQVRTLIGSRAASVSTPAKGSARALRIDVKPGNELELIAGASGKDALVKLGLDARRIASPAIVDKDAPKVRPGGSFALGLTEALRLDTKTEAGNSLAQIKQALSLSQTAYRSLYWDETKAQAADAPISNGRRPASTAIEQGQLANYQAALTRLSGSFTGF
ncbi:MAG TPA: hypothetical protein VF643_03170 [Sphingomonas sp.]|jgi:hypothetical protein